MAWGAMNVLIACPLRVSSCGPSVVSLQCIAARGNHGVGLYAPIAMSSRTPRLPSDCMISLQPNCACPSRGKSQMYDHNVLSMFASALKLSLLMSNTKCVSIVMQILRHLVASMSKNPDTVYSTADCINGRVIIVLDFLFLNHRISL